MTTVKENEVFLITARGSFINKRSRHLTCFRLVLKLDEFHILEFPEKKEQERGFMLFLSPYY